MSQDECRVPWDLLKKFTAKVFVYAGVSPDDAELQADTLIWANLRGVDSHGVLRIPWYLENIRKGVMNPKPNIHIIKESSSTLLIDADRSLGPVVTIFTMNMAIKKAKDRGICWALIRNLTHQGALGYYPLIAANHDMAGLAVVCSPPNMAPYGARVAGVHSSPIAISVPAKRHHPLLLDMATSVVAGGKIWFAKDKGIPIPEGWALNKEGKPTTDPKQVGALLPFGGPKGSGLALMFECLSSVMVGNPLLEPMLLGKPFETGHMTSASSTRPHIQNSLIAAIDISAFVDVNSYKEHIDNLIDGLKALPTAEGFNEIFVPGEPENRTLSERTKYGIPIPPKTIQSLRDISESFNIKVPYFLL